MAGRLIRRPGARRRTGVIALAVRIAWLLAILATPAIARANAGPPPDPRRPGDVAREPVGRIEGVAIEHETLVLDLRPVVDGAPAVVEATYRLRNDGASRTLELVFVAPALADGEPVVTLDGAPVASQPNPIADAPPSWEPPAMTPGLGGAADLPYTATGGRGIGFGIVLPPGAHDLGVRYQAQPSAYATADSPTRHWQLGYVLAPARQWASFGRLEITVLLPPDWRASSRPELQRVDDRLVGTFDGVPADALAITTRAPAPSAITPPFVVGPLGAIAAALAGWFGGSVLGRQGRRAREAWPLAVLLGGLWAVAMVVAGIIDPYPSAAIADNQRSWVYDYHQGSYGDTLQSIVLMPVWFVLGTIITLTGAFVGDRLARRQRR